MKRLICLLVILVTFNSCNEYQKALKSEDVATKFKLGTELYEAGKYNKANRLFTQIIPKYRGKPQAQKLMYMNAMSLYESGDYYSSNYQMERFVSSYPNSEKVQEIAFLSAKSYYHLSPVYTKEQKETTDAIDKLQGFINRFPDSEYLSEANTLVKELEYKLENKAYAIAKQYNLIEDFQASIKSFDNFILDFPGTSLREKAMFYRLDSAYKLAVNSVPWKKENRLNKAITYFNSFNKSFSDSELKTDADEMNDELNELIQAYNKKS